MNRSFLIAFCIVFVIGISACSGIPSEDVIQTAIAQTIEANPSATNSPQPTLTPSITPTPTKTSTPTKTATSTKTNTPTPPPPQTQTAEALFELKTVTARNATSTASALSRMRTVTAVAKSAKATEIASYSTVQWRDFITYPDKYKGQRIKISGQVFNINGDDQLQMWVGNYEAVYVVMKNSFSDLYENSWIIVYGTSDGEYCSQNAFGAEICQPILKNAFYVFP